MSLDKVTALMILCGEKETFLANLTINQLQMKYKDFKLFIIRKFKVFVVRAGN